SVNRAGESAAILILVGDGIADRVFDNGPGRRVTDTGDVIAAIGLLHYTSLRIINHAREQLVGARSCDADDESRKIAGDRIRVLRGISIGVSDFGQVAVGLRELHYATGAIFYTGQVAAY